MRVLNLDMEAVISEQVSRALCPGVGRAPDLELSDFQEAKAPILASCKHLTQHPYVQAGRKMHEPTCVACPPGLHDICKYSQQHR